MLEILKKYDVDGDYRKHYFPSATRMKVFLSGGVAVMDLETGEGYIEMTKKRLIFREANYLHYNPSAYWTWFSDIFSGALILLAISGILIPRGSDGLSARGAWLTILGVLIPLFFIIYYLY